jgi:hypothetical protein
MTGIDYHSRHHQDRGKKTQAIHSYYVKNVLKECNSSHLIMIESNYHVKIVIAFPLGYSLTVGICCI